MLYPRLARARITRALLDTRVVLLAGPRQAGKTTLAREIAAAAAPPTLLTTEGGLPLATESGVAIAVEPRTYFSLDNATVRDAALRDPAGFIRGATRVVIDEIQRAPELLLAIKESVDTDPRPGRFLLTGSANLMALPQIADSLAGRMETIHLFPLAQAELQRTRPTFLDKAFRGEVPSMLSAPVGDDLTAIVLAGGYPEAIARTVDRRKDWYREYVASIVQRDVRDIAQIDHLSQMPRLLRVLAEYSGKLVNHTEIGRRLELTAPTVRKYIDVFEQLYLIKTVQPWFSSTLNRLIRSPKVYFLDSGLLGALRSLSIERVQANRNSLGPLLETFVLGEVLKLASMSPHHFEIFHFRDKERNEVDIVIEDDQGRIIGIEIKSAATVRADDFLGLRKLAASCGDRFKLGVVLYDHDQTVTFGDRLVAAPVATLWH